MFRSQPGLARKPARPTPNPPDPYPLGGGSANIFFPSLPAATRSFSNNSLMEVYCTNTEKRSKCVFPGVQFRPISHFFHALLHSPFLHLFGFGLHHFWFILEPFCVIWLISFTSDQSGYFCPSGPPLGHLGHSWAFLGQNF